MICVLLDTNIWISALLFGGLPSRLLVLALARSLRIVTSPVLLDELDEKLRRKFRMPNDQADDTRLRLENWCDVISTTASISFVRDDPDDDRVLECAVAGRADYIISGDKHLLHLGSYNGIAIVTVREFMDIMNPPA
jgi:putative PIN family toxin of toxin-antitoxin system